MRFISVRDLRTKSTQIWKQLSEEHDMVLTSNGRPIAMLTAIDETNFEETLKNLRTAQTMMSVHNMQMQSVKNGLDKLTLDEINNIINEVRKESNQ